MTTRSHFLSHEELRSLEEATNISISSFFLSEFDTELEFKNKIGYGMCIIVLKFSSLYILPQPTLYYIRLITRVSVRYGEIFHEPKASEISRHISQLTSVISALFL